MPNTTIKNGIRGLAEHLGVSICTISRVLSGKADKYRISEATKQAVVKAAKDFNYTPNVNARRIFSKRSNMIGLLVPTKEEMNGSSVFSDLNFAATMCGLEEAILKTQYNIMLLYNSEEYKAAGRYDALFSSGLIDGLLVWGISRNDTYWSNLTSLTAPTIFLNTVPDSEDKTTFNYVTQDYEAAAYKAANYLFATRKCRKILWLSGKPTISITDVADNGLKRAIKKNKLTDDAVITMPGGYEFEDGRRAAVQALAGPSIDGVLAMSPHSAEGAFAMLQAAGHDCSVAYVMQDEIDQEHPATKLPHGIANNIAAGSTAIQELIRIIESGKKTKNFHKIIPCTYVNY